MHNYLNIILIIGLAQGIFLSIAILLTNKKKYLHNYFLSAMLFSFTILLAHQYLGGSFWLSNNIIFFFVSFSTPLLIGPCLYFYTVTLLQKKKQIDSKDFLHFSPFILCFIFFLLKSIFEVSPIEVRYESGNTPKYISILGSIKAIQWLGYGFYSFLIVYKFNKNNTVKKEFKPLLNWLKLFIIVFLLVWFTGLTAFILGHFNLPNTWLIDDIPSICSIIMLYIIGFYSIKRPNIIHNSKLDKKYNLSTLSSEIKGELIKTIILSMENEKYYRNNNLKLEELSNILEISPNHLSQIVNEHFNLNYQEFLNSYRVNDVKVKLLDPLYKNYTFLSIAFDAGFNSKSVFNRAFKKFTGMTPLQYQKSELKNPINES